MIQQLPEHPSPEQLKAFGLGKLAVADIDVISRHLDECNACRDTVAQQPDDALAALVRTVEYLPAVTKRAADTAAGVASSRPLAQAAELLAENPRYEVEAMLGRGG